MTKETQITNHQTPMTKRMFGIWDLEFGHSSTGERGVALLFVILLTSVLLLIAIGISNISFKELTFSLEARDSDKVFFTADTGIECGLYLDKQGFFDGTLSHPYECSGYPLTVVSLGAPTMYQFVFPMDDVCDEVSVDTAYIPPGIVADGTPDHPYYTAISSVGYNANLASDDPTRCVPLGTPPMRIVTRALRIRYPNSETTGGSGGGGGGPTVSTDTPAFDGTQWIMNGTVTSTGGATISSVGFEYGSASGSYTAGAGAGSSLSFSATDPFDPCPHEPVYYQAWAMTDTGIRVNGGDEQILSCPAP